MVNVNLEKMPKIPYTINERKLMQIHVNIFTFKKSFRWGKQIRITFHIFHDTHPRA